MSQTATHSDYQGAAGTSPVMVAIVIAVIIFFFLWEGQNIASKIGGSIAGSGSDNPATNNAAGVAPAQGGRNPIAPVNPSSVAAPNSVTTAPIATGPSPYILTPLFTLQDLLTAAGQVSNHAISSATSTTTPTTSTAASVG